MQMGPEDIFFLVPKTGFSDELWRMDFHDLEKKIIAKNPNCKIIIKLLKVKFKVCGLYCYHSKCTEDKLDQSGVIKVWMYLYLTFKLHHISFIILRIPFWEQLNGGAEP